MNTARDAILEKLREALARPELRFPPAQPEPLTDATRMTVGRAVGDQPMLAQRFGEELSKLYGSYEITQTPTEARLALINRLIRWMEQEEVERKGAVIATGQERSVLAWSSDQLPLEGLGPALNDLGLKLIAPINMRVGTGRDQVRHIRYGVTGVTAAFAATGSMLMVAGPGTNRVASLLPYRHLALIPFSRLYPTLEDWLAEQREAGKLEQMLRSRANLTMITGPSKSADIEMALTLGVHGPKFVHAILFDDNPIEPDDRVRPSDLFDAEPDDDGGFDEDDDERL
jgi:L-lactate dehydrogenase complex protein LldG